MKRVIVLLVLVVFLLASCGSIDKADLMRRKLMDEGIKVSEPGIRKDKVIFFFQIKDKKWLPRMEAIGTEWDHSGSLWMAEIDNGIIFGDKPRTKENAMLWICNYLEEI